MRGKPTRVGKEEVWVVNISSLKQLSDFSDKYGPLVFNSDRFDIYDDYIE